MDRKIIQAAIHMTSLVLEELAPPEDRASVRDSMTQMASALEQLLDALEVGTAPSILDTLRVDAERARINLAATMALVRQGGASEPRILAKIGEYRVHQALLEQELIHTLLTLPRVATAQAARGDVH